MIPPNDWPDLLLLNSMQQHWPLHLLRYFHERIWDKEMILPQYLLYRLCPTNPLLWTCSTTANILLLLLLALLLMMMMYAYVQIENLKWSNNYEETCIKNFLHEIGRKNIFSNYVAPFSNQPTLVCCASFTLWWTINIASTWGSQFLTDFHFQVQFAFIFHSNSTGIR